MSAVRMLLALGEEDRRRLARLARLTYGRSGDRIEAEIAGRLLADVLTERLDLVERIARAPPARKAA